MQITADGDDEMAFWGEHSFFRPPGWTLPWARTAQESGSVQEDQGHG
jgi:hypothetical protein